MRKEARYHNGKPERKYPGEVLSNCRGKETDETEDDPAPDKRQPLRIRSKRLPP